MPDPSFDPYQLISQAPATALAVLVYLELRALKPILRTVDKLLARLLERDRMRSEPHRIPSERELSRRAPTSPGRPDLSSGIVTDDE